MEFTNFYDIVHLFEFLRACDINKSKMLTQLQFKFYLEGISRTGLQM